MTRFKITIEYDGTEFFGWQKQPGAISVQETIENALYKLSGENIKIFASGRTDAGVHALGQVAHFDLIKDFRPFQIMMGINDHLRNNSEESGQKNSPPTAKIPARNVIITDCEIVDENFHSRFDAKMRHYQYLILNRRASAVIQAGRVWQIPYELNVEAMIEAAQYLIGKYDFTSFRDSKCQAKNSVRTIENIKISKENNLIKIEVSAKSFLHHMVRNIVGTLVLVGGGKIAASEMKNILAAKDRTKSGSNAPAYGLYLTKIDY